eukprot:GSA25T00009898001.1
MLQNIASSASILAGELGAGGGQPRSLLDRLQLELEMDSPPHGDDDLPKPESRDLKITTSSLRSKKSDSKVALFSLSDRRASLGRNNSMVLNRGAQSRSMSIASSPSKRGTPAVSPAKRGSCEQVKEPSF